MGDINDDWSLYPYTPNNAASIVFCNFFAYSMGMHVYQCIRFKSWKVTGCLAWGCLLFVVGFALRQVSIQQKHAQNLGIFIASQVFLVIAPPVFSLSNYILLGRFLYYIPYLSPMHPGRVISTFVGLDAVIGALTANGAVIASDRNNSASQIRSGRNQFRASILLQLFCFIGFVFLEIIFHRRCLKAKNIVTPRLRSVFFLLYASSGLILVRNIYRVIEVFQGWDGYIGSHEAFFYAFDGALMIINTAMFNIMHPMMFLPNSINVYLATDGCSERMGPGWMDKRNFFVTLIDPFDIIGLIRGKDKKEKFWEREEEFPIIQGEEGRGWCRNTKGREAPPPPPPPPPSA